MEFRIMRYTSDTLSPAWEGTLDAADAPIAFLPDMREFGPRMDVGDTLTLNAWHYAIRTA